MPVKRFIFNDVKGYMAYPLYKTKLLSVNAEATWSYGFNGQKKIEKVRLALATKLLVDRCSIFCKTLIVK